MKSRFSQIAVVIIALIAVLVLGACSSAVAPEEREVYVEQMAPMEAPASTADFAAGSSTSSFEPAAPPAQVERLVIKNANSILVVDDPAVSMDVIVRLADELGGYVVAANLYHNTLADGIEVPGASVTIRVPADSFDDALQRIRLESDREPLNETINSQDVTSEYTDLQSRLRNLEAAEDQLTEIMESAARTEDVLSVYNELVRVREQIEIIQGQIKYYEQSAAMSAISVELRARESVQPLTIGGWEPKGVIKGAVQALIDTLKVLVNIVIWLIIYILPVLIVLFIIFVLPLILIVRYIRSRRRRLSSQVPPPPAE